MVAQKSPPPPPHHFTPCSSSPLHPPTPSFLTPSILIFMEMNGEVLQRGKKTQTSAGAESETLQGPNQTEGTELGKGGRKETKERREKR